MSNQEFKISRKTKSRAYQFIKSLMNDNIDPTKIHNLMDAIRDNVDKDVAGEILFDLLKNPEDPNGNLDRHSTWFGPVSVNYWNHVFEILTEYLEDEDMRGWIRFGDKTDWDEWNKKVKTPLTESKLKDARNDCQNQLIHFAYWADSTLDRKTERFVLDLHNRIQSTEKKRKA